VQLYVERSLKVFGEKGINFETSMRKKEVKDDIPNIKPMKDYA